MLVPGNTAENTIKIAWWNVNRRLETILSHVSPIDNEKPQIIFTIETSLGFDFIPELKNYKKFADKNIVQLNHGGIVAYIASSIASHVFNITYHECYISLRLDFFPNILFVGTYIQPENSQYFSYSMFDDLSNLLMNANERKLIPLVGGDINCRFGALDAVFQHKGIRYDVNVDHTSNFHGRTFGVDLCNTSDIFPINHLKYKSKVFTGDFTYFKGDKKSQIDFVFTNREGIRCIKEFYIPSENWHLSDHRPTMLVLNTPSNVQTSALLRRSKDLNYVFDPHTSIPTRYLSVYNNTVFERNLRDNFERIEKGICSELHNENIDKAIAVFDEELDSIYRKSKERVYAAKEKDSLLIENANEHFNNYRKCKRGEIAADESEMLKKYIDARKVITKDICTKEHNRWNEITEDTNCKRLWDRINWKGGITKDTTSSPIIEDLTLHFEKLHEGGKDDLVKIEQLKTDVYNHDLDKPISSDELKEGMKKMKNGGFDHRIDKFKIITDVLSPIILLLMNILFFVAYPVKLAISLLTAIPKAGNLSLPKNYRGIQMMAALAVLFDRIVTFRIDQWIKGKISDVQSGFQKFKSTLHQIFTLRLLTEIAKKNNTTLYIGLFDLEKAFDKISRYKLLKKLVTMGISNTMLQALKRLYLYILYSYLWQ